MKALLKNYESHLLFLTIISLCVNTAPSYSVYPDTISTSLHNHLGAHRFSVALGATVAEGTDQSSRRGRGRDQAGLGKPRQLTVPPYLAAV